MTKKIILGKTEDGHEISLNQDKLVESRMIVQANSGGGKSGLIRVLCERTKGLPFMLFDLEGEYASLREKVDLVLVGPDGDIPNDIRSVGLLMRKLIELRVSSVINLYEFAGVSGRSVVQQRREYIAAALTALVNLPKSHWLPLLLILDELQVICPERGGQKDVVSTQPVIDAIALGRKRGYAVVGASQRFSKVHNDALAELKNVFIGGTWLDVDQKRAGDYLGLVGNDRRTLRDLEKQQFYCFGPALSIKGVNKFKVDNCETSFPKAGEAQTIAPPKASDAITQIISQIDDLPAEAEQEKKDVESLQIENRELKQLLADRPTIPEPIETIKEIKVEIPVMAANAIAAAESVADTISNKIVTLITDLNVHIGELEHVRDGFLDGVAKVTGVSPETPVPTPQGVPQPPKTPTVSSAAPTNTPPPTRTAPPPPPPAADGSFSLNGYQRDLLNGLAELKAIGIGEPSRVQLSFITKKKAKSSHFGNMLGALRTNAYIDYPGDGKVSLTAIGEAHASATGRPATRSELHRRVRDLLNSYQQELFDAIFMHYPNAISRKDLAAQTNKSESSSHFGNMLGEMRTMEIVEYPQDKFVRAAESLFPAGLPA